MKTCKKCGENVGPCDTWTHDCDKTESSESGLNELLYGGMSPEYVKNMEKHRNILAAAFAEIKVASESEDVGRIKEVVAGCILEIRAI
jgi:hypothetical protein